MKYFLTFTTIVMLLASSLWAQNERDKKKKAKQDRLRANIVKTHLGHCKKCKVMAKRFYKEAKERKLREKAEKRAKDRGHFEDGDRENANDRKRHKARKHHRRERANDRRDDKRDGDRARGGDRAKDGDRARGKNKRQRAKENRRQRLLQGKNNKKANWKERLSYKVLNHARECRNCRKLVDRVIRHEARNRHAIHKRKKQERRAARKGGR